MFKTRVASPNSAKQAVKKPWFIFRFEFLLIFGIALIAVIINQVPNWIINKNAIDPKTGMLDPNLAYPLRNTIWYPTLSLTIVIFAAVLIGVYSEIGRFIGKYGSAIFILVPSFVWLFSDRTTSHVIEVLDATSLLSSATFYGLIALFCSFVLFLLLKEIIISKMISTHKKTTTELIFNFIYRIHIIFINIAMVLLLSISFINYAIFTLRLADLAKPGYYDLHSEKMTTFIAVVAVLFASIMVLTGLSTVFTKNVRVQEEQEERIIKKEKMLKKQGIYVKREPTIKIDETGMLRIKRENPKTMDKEGREIDVRDLSEEEIKDGKIVKKLLRKKKHKKSKSNIEKTMEMFGPDDKGGG